MKPADSSPDDVPGPGLRVLHFVTGGFSGATQVAIDLCRAARSDPQMRCLLVLRRKRTTDMHRVEGLRAQGLEVRVVSNWLHARTVWELRQIIRDWRANVVFAHGFSDHIWGRQAAVAEHVPCIFHVEHNARERYTARRLRQALALMPATCASIGVSEGVRQSLVARGFPAEQCLAIPNGINLSRFPSTLLRPWGEREPAIIMASRFARQKDHASLLEALALLRQQGLRPPLYLAGGGRQHKKRAAQVLCMRLGLQDQVHFLGVVRDLPERLARTRFFVLSSHWEGMPLALQEGLAAGCACVASDVVGSRELIDDGRTGLLVAHASPQDLAAALARLLRMPDLAAALAKAGRQHALAHFGRQQMWQAYRQLVLSECKTGQA